MKKQYLTQTKSGFSYHLKRACRNCGAPIPDQESATREFCPKTYDENGKVRDCKTKFHRENDKPDRDANALYLAKLKATTSRIDFLIKKMGYEVSTEDLDSYEILLNEAIQYNITPEGMLTSIFQKHIIVSNPITNIHKISYHD